MHIEPIICASAFISLSGTKPNPTSAIAVLSSARLIFSIQQKPRVFLPTQHIGFIFDTARDMAIKNSMHTTTFIKYTTASAHMDSGHST